MQLQRRYNLPNCTLLLDGLADTTGDPGYSQRLGVLMNLDCYLSGQAEPLSGGIDFLMGLMNAVSHYAQQCLSEIPHPQCQSTGSWVKLRSIAVDEHQIEVYENPSAEPARRVSLTTVQFFDLVEALDQLLADPLTLPQLSIPLSPLSRQDVASHLPLAQKAATPAIGVAGLATAATLFFLAPVPQIQRPLVDPALNGQQSSSTPSPSSTPTAANPVPVTREALVALNSKIYNQIDAAWTQTPTYSDNLTFRVSVNPEGVIRGYRANDDRATQYENETPLPKLVTVAPAGTPPETLTDFKVVLTPQGRIEVNPWNGFPPEQAASSAPVPNPNASNTPAGNTNNPSTSASPVASATAVDLKDPNAVSTLTDRLRSQLDEKWTTSPTFNDPIVFQFEVNSQGQILDFKPASTSASSYVPELGFRDLKLPNPSPATAAAKFRVVFTPKGVIEVSPWDGF